MHRTVGRVTPRATSSDRSRPYVLGGVVVRLAIVVAVLLPWERAGGRNSFELLGASVRLGLVPDARIAYALLVAWLCIPLLIVSSTVWDIAVVAGRAHSGYGRRVRAGLAAVSCAAAAVLGVLVAWFPGGTVVPTVTAAAGAVGCICAGAAYRFDNRH